MKINLDQSVHDFLAELDAKRYRQVCQRLLGLCRAPLPHDSRHLSGHPGLRRVDVGEFRIVYTVAGDTVEVILVGRRNDDEVYRELRRRSS